MKPRTAAERITRVPPTVRGKSAQPAELPLRENAKPRLGIVLSNGWSLRNILLSGAMGLLEERFDLVVWATPHDRDRLRDVARKVGVHGAQWEPFVSFVEGTGHRFVRQVQQSLFLGRIHASTEEIRLRSRRVQRGTLQRLAGRVVGTVGKSFCGGTALHFASLLRRRLGYRAIYTEAFDRHGLDLLVVTNPVDYCEEPFVFEAARRGVPVAAFVASWDNLSSKGVIHADYDRVMVWNEVMRKEVLRYYPTYRPEQVAAIGVPRFDAYQRPLPPEFDRERFLTSLGMDPKKRLLLYANTATTLIPGQPQIIRHICEAMQDGSLPQDTQLLIRPHPQDSYDQYAYFGSVPRVRVWQPTVPTQQREWTPEPTDDLILAAMLRHAAVSLNPFSTMTLDAAMCDTPIISIGYDGDVNLPYIHSVIGAYDYSHMVPVMAYGATTLCRDRHEMIEGINAYLANPGLHRRERGELARDFCLAGAGTAVDRLVSVLVDWASARL